MPDLEAVQGVRREMQHKCLHYHIYEIEKRNKINILNDDYREDILLKQS